MSQCCVLWLLYDVCCDILYYVMCLMCGVMCCVTLLLVVLYYVVVYCYTVICFLVMCCAVNMLYSVTL